MNDSALFYLGKIPILSNILQTGEFNHHVVFVKWQFLRIFSGQGGVLHMWILLRPCWVHFAGEAWKWRRSFFFGTEKGGSICGVHHKNQPLHGKSGP